MSSEQSKSSIGRFLIAGGSSQILRKAQSKRNARGLLLPVFLVTPSAVAIIVFIYGFILFTLWTSFSRWSSPVMNLNLRDPAWMTYTQMFGNDRWQCDL